MNNNSNKPQLPTSASTELASTVIISYYQRLIEDAERRIGSHVSLCREIDQYVLDQIKLIEKWSVHIVDMIGLEQKAAEDSSCTDCTKASADCGVTAPYTDFIQKPKP